VIEVLGLGGHRPAAPALEHALTDPESEVRVAAARAIGRLRAEGCGLALMSALRDEAWPVRAQAAWALGRTRSGIAIRPLAARVADQAWWVRRHAAYALAELGEEGRLALREIAYGSDDRYAREMALEVLGGGFKEYHGGS
jgi:HEAT repeat protein